MSKNTITLISGSTTYYLSGSHTPYNGTGSPWTGETTTPFELSLNDVTGPAYTPAPAAGQMVYRGGPPFGIGQRPYTKAYGNVTETVALQVRATTKNNAVFLLQTLQRALNTALVTAPAQLGVQMGTNAAYAEIYQADVTLLPTYLTDGASDSDATLFRCAITWTRSGVFGVRDANDETVIGSGGAESLTNTGSSGDNVEILGALSGDLADDVGQPLNCYIDSFSANSGSPYYIATVRATDWTDTNTSLATSSQTGTTTSTGHIHDMTPYLDNAAFRPRTLMRITGGSANLEVALQVTDTTSGTVVYTSSFQAPGTSSVLLDFGEWSAEPWRAIATSGLATALVKVIARSTNGSITTGTVDYVETLDCYTFAAITGISVSTSQLLQCITYPNLRDDVVCLPLLSSFANSVTPSGTLANLGTLGTVRGELPRAYTGASIWFAWHDSNGTQTTSRTADLVVRHAPLWISGARGAD